MKNPIKERLWISRQVRVALVDAILLISGAIAFAAGDVKLGMAFLLIVVAMVAAFYFAVIRPALIPRDAVLVVKLAGAIEEDVTGSPIDQILRRGAHREAELRHP